MVLVAVSLLTLTGVAGLVVDGGRAWADRRQAQNAADAAAMAAAIAQADGDTAAEARTAALNYASQNGYNNDGTTNTVTVNMPPTSGEYSGDAKYVEVIVTRQMPTTFARVMHDGDVKIYARAVAGYSQKDDKPQKTKKTKTLKAKHSKKKKSKKKSKVQDISIMLVE